MNEPQIIQKKDKNNYLCLDCQYEFQKPYYKHRFDGITMIRKAYCPKCDSYNLKKIKIGFKTLF